MKKWKIIKNIVIIAYTLTITYLATQCAFEIAYAERGYDAIGGEYVVIPVAAYVAYRTITIVAENIEEDLNEKIRNSNKKRNRDVDR